MIHQKILVTGANGQLGNEIKILSSHYNYDFVFHDIDTLDICNITALDELFNTTTFYAVINCAAYTAVDKAETEQKLAYKVNAEAVKNLSTVTKKYDSYLIHISTDYVFNGTNHTPYTENDATCPQSIYGKSKLEGEQAILANAGNAMIIRTAWLYSSFGNNFVKTMQKYGRERGLLNVVCDQIGTPTYAADLAKAILQNISNLPIGIEIFHYSNEGVCSWYDFAKSIIEFSIIECEVSPIETRAYPTPAHRPPYSVLNKSKFKTTFNTTIPYWRNSLKECISIMGNPNTMNF